MNETPVVTCFLRNEDAVLLLRRGEAGPHRGRWGGVLGRVASNDPEQDARRAIDDATGLGDAVALVRRGAAFPVEDDALSMRWIVHPFLFDCDRRPVRGGREPVEAVWVPPPEILRREAVPQLWAAYCRAGPTLESIRTDRRHGSAWLSFRALEVLRDRAAEERLGEDAASWTRLCALADALRTARPPMAAIANRVNRAMYRAREAASAEAVERAAQAALRDAIDAEEAVARRAAGFVSGRRVFTLSRSGTVLSALRRADPPPARIVIAASEPGGEGRTVAEALAKQGVPVTLVADAAVAQIFEQEQADVVLVGADAVLRSGHVVNKVGTLTAASWARHHHVPCYAAAATDKIRTDDAAPLEDAAPATLYDGDAPLAPFNPLFEVTPARYFSGLITEDGILAATDVQDVAFELKTMADW